jgi:hypothetical protein
MCRGLLSSCDFLECGGSLGLGFCRCGLNFDKGRRLLWDELVGVISLWNLPWCIGGDFNVTRFPSERSGTTCLDNAMMDLLDLFLNKG